MSCGCFVMLREASKQAGDGRGAISLSSCFSSSGSAPGRPKLSLVHKTAAPASIRYPFPAAPYPSQGDLVPDIRYISCTRRWYTPTRTPSNTFNGRTDGIPIAQNDAPRPLVTEESQTHALVSVSATAEALRVPDGKTDLALARRQDASEILPCDAMSSRVADDRAHIGRENPAPSRSRQNAITVTSTCILNIDCWAYGPDSHVG